MFFFNFCADKHRQTDRQTHGQTEMKNNAWAALTYSAKHKQKGPEMNILLQQVAESYLLAHASLSVLTRNSRVFCSCDAPDIALLLSDWLKLGQFVHLVG